MTDRNARHHPTPRDRVMRPVLLPLLCLAALSACGGGSSRGDTTLRAGSPSGVAASAGPTPTAGDSLVHPAWSRNAVIYEVNIRQYTPAGHVRRAPGSTCRASSGSGVDILWLMPVQPIGEEVAQGALGSYYVDRRLHGDQPRARHRGRLPGASSTRRTAGDEGDPRLGGEPHRVRPRVDHRAPRLVRRTAPTARSPTRATTRAARPTGPTSRSSNYDNAAMRAGDGRRDALVARRHGHRRLPLRRGRRRADGLLGATRAAQLRAARARHVHAGRGREPGDARRVRHDVRVGAASPAERDRAGEEAHAPRSTPTSRGRTARYGRRMRTGCTSPATTTRTAGTARSSSGWAPTTSPRSCCAATARNGMPLLYTGQEASMRKRLRFFEKDTVDWSGPSLAPTSTARCSRSSTRRPRWRTAPGGGPQVALGTDGGDARLRLHAHAGRQHRARGGQLRRRAEPARRTQGLPQPARTPTGSARRAITLAAAGSIDVPAHGYRVLVQ